MLPPPRAAGTWVTRGSLPSTGSLPLGRAVDTERLSVIMEAVAGELSRLAEVAERVEFFFRAPELSDEVRRRLG